MKKILFLLTFLVFFTLNAGQSFAANWVSVGYDSKGYEWLYDADSILVKNVYYDKRNSAKRFMVVYAKVHPNKATWYQGELIMYPENRTVSCIRWEKHKEGKTRYTYWTYDEEQEYYSSRAMYDSLGQALLRRY